jgi:hypothetical protein
VKRFAAGAAGLRVSLSIEWRPAISNILFFLACVGSPTF